LPYVPLLIPVIVVVIVVIVVVIVAILGRTLPISISVFFVLRVLKFDVPKGGIQT
jgi:hypothetical protein